MRVLIVDDERLARSELRRLLAAHDWIEVAGEARDAGEAEKLIRELDPDLLLLDIQMPGRTGFELLESLDEVPPVIFTTAYDQYALKAFEVSALDYLLKPIAPDRLAAALAKFRRSEPAHRPVYLDQVFVKDGDRCWFVRTQEIFLFESEGNYTRLYFGKERPLIPRSLVALEERLDPAKFFRASRRHIVYLPAIASIDTAVNGNLTALLHNGCEVELSRRQSLKLKQTMSL